MIAFIVWTFKIRVTAVRPLFIDVSRVASLAVQLVAQSDGDEQRNSLQAKSTNQCQHVYSFYSVYSLYMWSEQGFG